MALCSSLTLLMFEIEIRVWFGVFFGWESVERFFLLGRVKKQPVPCRFCGSLDGDGHLFWECTFPPH